VSGEGKGGRREKRRGRRKEGEEEGW